MVEKEDMRRKRSTVVFTIALFMIVNCTHHKLL